MVVRYYEASRKREKSKESNRQQEREKDYGKRQ
jgi:hypothetical protein